MINDPMPHIELPRDRFKAGVPAWELFWLAGLAASKSEARRLIRQGGAYVNRERVEAEEALIDEKFLLGDKVLLRAGKKRFRRAWAV